MFNCHITGLAVARSLAAHGIEVIALDPDPRGLGQASKAVVERHKCPNPLEDERGFVQYLLDNAKRFGEGAVLFPTNDEWVLAVARYRSQLEACYRIPFSELSVIDAVLDKRRLYADAHHLGIPIPKTFTLNDPKATAREIRYPAIVKPAEQRRFYDRFGVKVFRAENAAELVRFAREAADLACVAQEIVDVPAGGFYSFCSYVAPDGELRGAFVGRKLEQYPEGFGTGCLVIGEQVSEIVERGSASRSGPPDPRRPPHRRRVHRRRQWWPEVAGCAAVRVPRAARQGRPAQERLQAAARQGELSHSVSLPRAEHRPETTPVPPPRARCFISE